ncbi:MAG: hypothetical protein WCS98_04770 [Bacillota bacterium]|nr:hypothetical protein [Bacillota bacterium]MDD3298101.1 hypothetical protein [Bacillota bacterium]MDD4707424.1 hypothetical protein [Bacillota bacterium]
MDKGLVKRTLFCFVLAFLLLISMLTGCGRREQRPAQQAKKENIPVSLTKIVENSQTIIEQMEKLQKEMQKPVQPSGEGGGQDGQGTEGGGGGGGGGGGQSPPDPEQEKKQRIDKMWEDTLKTVEDTHKQWNDYENTAVKDNARDESIVKFETHLNTLTVTINQRDSMAVMDEANGMALVAADFLALYRDNPDSEIVRVRHYLQQTCVDARRNRWDEARRSISSAKQAMGKLEQKAELEEADKGLIDKLRLSIDNLGNSMLDRDLDLLKIKKDIALANLDEVEKKAK